MILQNAPVIIIGCHRSGTSILTETLKKNRENEMNELLKGEFDGPDYQHALDFSRLTGQIERIFTTMADKQWRTLREIESITNDPQASISAQLRHLRKPKFGNHQLHKRRRGDRTKGLFEYSLHKKGCVCQFCNGEKYNE